jgi:hypothetical protein
MKDSEKSLVSEISHRNSEGHGRIVYLYLAKKTDIEEKLK